MAVFEFERPLSVEETGIPGVLVFNLTVHGDNRGWFKENWQREKMLALGLPDMGPVQNNISFNEKAGTTRGIHAEPWDKYISVAAGSVFGAWVDLRPGDSFGRVFTCTLSPSKAIYIPRGVGNSFQALEDGTVYTYLVNEHWSSSLKKSYAYVNLADPDLSIEWPIPLEECEVSDADKHHPMLKDIAPVSPRRTLVTGCDGQLGRAMHALVENRGMLDSFDFLNSDEFDISGPSFYEQVDWASYGVVVNCGAYTSVDLAETREGRQAAWSSNALGPALLARVCSKHRITLVHISSDYVFDGTRKSYDENEPLCPISVYGQSKAAGDIAVAGCARHYILRCSWIVGEGANFVGTMAALSNRVADVADSLKTVTVVNDQFGRLSFARDIAAAILHVLESDAPYGTYNCTGSGPVASWADIARIVFDAVNCNGEKVIPVSTDEYYAGSKRPIAPRPACSVLDLSKLEATGFFMPNWEDELHVFLKQFCPNC